MHIADGIMSAPVCVTAALGAGGATIAGLRGLPDRQVPRLAVMTALFFVVGALHVPVGAGSVHFLFTGLLAAVLGWRAIVPVTVGVLMHAVLLQHGGLTAMGINALVLGLPALVVGALAQRWYVAGSPQRAWCVGASATVATYLLSMMLLLATVALADGRLSVALGAWVAMHLPIMVLEAVVTGSAVACLAKVREGVWQPCYARDLS